MLSICVPTYNRKDWLAALLSYVVPQVQAAEGAVELVVSDNDSTDGTDALVQQVSELCPICYLKQNSNIGAEANFQAALQHSTAPYAWILGDDDFPRPNAVAEILNAIQRYPDIKYLFVNYQVWPVNQAPSPGEPLPEEKSLPDRGHESSENRLLDRLVDIVGGDPNCFTPISCSIMQRGDFIKALYRNPSLERFASAESVSAFVIYIARNFFNQPAFFFGAPLMVLGTASTWQKYQAAFVLIVYPQLHQIFEQCGASRKVVDTLRARLCKKSGVGAFRQMVIDKSTPCRAHFSYFRYLLQNRRIKFAYEMPVRALLMPLLFSDTQRKSMSAMRTSVRKAITTRNSQQP